MTVDDVYKMQLLCAYEVCFVLKGTCIGRLCNFRLSHLGIRSSVNSSQRRNGKGSIMREFIVC